MVYTGITGTSAGIITGQNLDLSGVLPPGQSGNCFTSNGQLWIGSTTPTVGGTNSKIGHITSPDGSINVTNLSGEIRLTGQSQPFVPNAVLQEFDDFISSITSDSKLDWKSLATSFFQSDGTVDHPGIYSLTADPGENVVVFLQQDTLGGTGVGPFALGGGITTINWVVQLTGLSAGGNTYRFSCGLADTTTLEAQSDSFVNGVYFTYTNTVNSGNYQIKNTAASVTTTASTTVAANTSWVTFSIVINAAATSVAYYIDGNQVSVSPLTTNIPTASLTPFVCLINTAGTTPQFNIDLFWCTVVLSNPRPGPTHGTPPADNRLIEAYTATATDYQVIGTDAIIGVTSTADPRTITMPLAPTVGQRWTIKDESGGAAANNITVAGNGWLIDGAATFVINTDLGSVDVYFSGLAYFIV